MPFFARKSSIIDSSHIRNVALNFAVYFQVRAIKCVKIESPYGFVWAFWIEISLNM